MACCFFFLIIAPASASYISLQTALTSKYENGRLTVKVTVVNKGDESAFNVQPELIVGGKNVLANKLPELPVNQRFEAQTSVPLALKTPGNYPLTLAMHYTDANQYPFTALIAQTFVNGKETSSPIFGQIKPVSFVKDGELELTLKNSANNELKLENSMLAPRELTIDSEMNGIKLAPRSEAKQKIAVRNFSALPGSTYQVFAVSQFEAGGLHYTSITPGIVRVAASQTLLGLSYTAIVILLGLLIAALIAAQFIGRRTH